MRNRIVLFFKSPIAGGIVLILASIMGIMWANAPLLRGLYHDLMHISIFGMQMHVIINDGLMAIFFLYVGLEVKREMLIGQLNTNSKRLFPGLAALCGFIVPAVVYFIFSKSGGAPINGWAIPTATDIAFALGVIAILESKVPKSLKTFLTALAVIDDLMAIIVIAIFYSSGIQINFLVLSSICIILLIILNKKKVHNSIPYMILGAFLWYFVFNSGLHATLAGVVLAMAIPLDVVKGNKRYHPLIRWEHSLSNWVTFLIVPVFGFANAGVSFDNFNLSEFTNPIVLGIGLGLFIGKQLGVFSLMFAMIKLKIVPMPKNSTWRQIFGVSVICGIGFTMSLFVSMLAFSNPADLDHAKVGVFAGSLLSATLGAIVIATGPKIVTNAMHKDTISQEAAH